jgi:putative DNA primase/helicase
MFGVREIARALGGEVVGASVLAPGPGHSRRDRSLSVTPAASAPDGFLVFSHAGDDWRACRDHVAKRLGIERAHAASRSHLEGWRLPAPSDDEGRADKTGAALALWRASINPRGTIVESYLASRGLELDDEVSLGVIHWHAGTGAIVALFRSIETDAPQAVSRTYLDIPVGASSAGSFSAPSGAPQSS